MTRLCMHGHVDPNRQKFNICFQILYTPCHFKQMKPQDNVIIAQQFDAIYNNLYCLSLQMHLRKISCLYSLEYVMSLESMLMDKDNVNSWP